MADALKFGVAMAVVMFALAPLLKLAGVISSPWWLVWLAPVWIIGCSVFAGVSVASFTMLWLFLKELRDGR